MATVTMSQAHSNYSTTSSSNQPNYNENDLSSKFGRIKFSDGPTLIVCDIDNDGCNNALKRSNEDGAMMMMITASTSKTAAAKTPATPSNITGGNASTPSLKEAIERSPSTSSLSVPTIDVDEKRPPLPDETMMIDDAL
uniref:Uncharacterized protein n=1 Tax=Tetranychus urticae TaxID=32264 RepID=T1KET6_TETUR